jgi:hypothetical protein
MQKTTLLLGLLFLSACNEQRNESTTPSQTPKALQTESSPIISYKRGYSEDLIEQLYAELTQTDKELKKLEEGLQQLNETANDSTAVYDHYSSKNKSYYDVALLKTEKITDSLLKRQIKSLMENSQLQYQSLTSAHRALLADIDVRRMRLSDLHTALKLYRTLAVIEQYQKSNLPSTKPLEAYRKEVERLTKMTDKLLEAN